MSLSLLLVPCYVLMSDYVEAAFPRSCRVSKV